MNDSKFFTGLGFLQPLLEKWGWTESPEIKAAVQNNERLVNGMRSQITDLLYLFLMPDDDGKVDEYPFTPKFLENYFQVQEEQFLNYLKPLEHQTNRDVTVIREAYQVLRNQEKNLNAHGYVQLTDPILAAIHRIARRGYR